MGLRETLDWLKLMTPSSAARDHSEFALYGGRDPRELPRYTSVEAGRATGVPPSTIRAWFRGQVYARKHSRGHFKPVLKLADPSDTRLTYNNLLEIFALRSLRDYHDVKLDNVRRALDYAEQHLDVPRLLISSQLRFSGGDLFLDSYFDLVQLAPAVQHSIRSVLKQYLQRINFEDAPGLYPTPRHPRNTGQKLILVSPMIAFGRSVVERLGVSTSAISERVDSEEDPAAVMYDYDLRDDELDEALAYESAFRYDPAA